MRKFFILCSLLALSFMGMAQKNTDKQMMLDYIDEHKSTYGDMAQKIWEYAEVGYQEEKSVALLQQHLQEEGFEVTAGVADIPTAFTASYGSGAPVIAILGEYDALPGLSQAAVPQREVMVEGGAGHGCGHNLFGSGSAAAAVAIKEWLKASGAQGTIRFYGTPAEEGGAGKVYMVRAGLFDDVDAVLHWHPGSSNSAVAASSLANKSAKFRFHGIAAHASSSPDKARSALDGVEAMNDMVNLLREHVPMETRIHYVITSGGEAPNVVPAFAEVYYYVRHPEVGSVKEIFERVVKAAEGAAIGTGTEMDYEIIHGIYNVQPNETLAKLMDQNLRVVGGVHYSEEEKAFAEKLQTSLNEQVPISKAEEVEPFEVIERGRGGSTDVGDISWVVPTAGLRTACFVPGTPGHSWQSTAAGGTSIGTKGLIVAAKTLAITAYDLFSNPEIIREANQELEKRQGENFEYESLVGDREPPLDYRGSE
ncbi:aminobenzoyl-glutamate utilization protein B [Catalinimonas alkaloidigena]|uniref:amidohydrolase n=1 Tax=Catalinimonas alkaloidigena TaxID=1075417 RepID=UPI002406CF38|nr:amidohydrolase [Catalinimonas alkaloidigena]MDF9795418.1 aminobenzoyl-glutamate utilization protein B [Catalinimonas alkaloidigena]